MSWSKRLERLVVPPDGKIIVTLADAQDYVLTLPKDRQNDPVVLAGVEAILMAAESRAPILLAQSGVAHIVHGPANNWGKHVRPGQKRKARS